MNWPYRNTVLVCCTAAFFAVVTARLVVSPVVPDIVDSFGVSNSAVGLALSGMWAAYALTQFPSGILGDRFGERRTILAAVGLTAAASGLLALSPTFPIFAVLVFCLGIAAGLHYIVATSLLTRNFEQTGRAIGFHVTGAPLAGLVSPAVAAVVATRYGWRAAVLIGTVVAVPTFALFFWFVELEPARFPDRPMRDRLEIGPITNCSAGGLSCIQRGCPYSARSHGRRRPPFSPPFSKRTTASLGQPRECYSRCTSSSTGFSSR